MPQNALDFINEGVSIPLSKLAAGYSPMGLVADKILPVVPHVMQAGKVPVFGKDALKVHNTKRAPGAASNRVRFDPGSWVSFACEEHDVAIPLDHRALAKIPSLPNADMAAFNMQDVARSRAQWNISIRREYDVATLLQATSTYASGHYTTLTTEWDAEGGAPLTDIETGREKVRSAIGRYPNVMLLGADAYSTLKFHSDYTDLLKLTENKVVRPEIIAAVHDLDAVYIGMAAQADSAGAMTDLWSDNCLLAYVPTSPSIEEPALGYTIRPMGGTAPYPYVDVFVEEGGKIVNVRCTDCFDLAVLMNTGGYLIKNCKA